MTTPRPQRSFVIVGETARAEEGVLLQDLPGTSGRLDVLLRCVRAAMCISHGIRRDTRIYLVLKGSHVSRVVRIDGATAKFIRPDERALATMVLKAIARAKADGDPSCFVPQRLGIAVAAAGLEAVLEDVQGEPLFVLEEGAPDLRKECLSHGVFFIGDHVGFHDCVRAKLKARGALARGIGPVSLHSDDVVTLVHNALDLAASGLG